MKKQGDFVVYSRNSVLINALVAFSRQVFLPEGPTEHLTLVYLDPAAASAAPTGEQLRNSIKVQADVPPLAEGAVNGWKEVESDVATGKATSPEEQDAMFRDTQARIQKRLDENGGDAGAASKLPSAADLDAAAAEQKAKEATGGRDSNGVPSIVGLGDGTVTPDGTFVPDAPAAPDTPAA